MRNHIENKFLLLPLLFAFIRVYIMENNHQLLHLFAFICFGSLGHTIKLTGHSYHALTNVNSIGNLFLRATKYERSGGAKTPCGDLPNSRCLRVKIQSNNELASCWESRTVYLLASHFSKKNIEEGELMGQSLSKYS